MRQQQPPTLILTRRRPPAASHGRLRPTPLLQLPQARRRQRLLRQREHVQIQISRQQQQQPHAQQPHPLPLPQRQQQQQLDHRQPGHRRTRKQHGKGVRSRRAGRRRRRRRGYHLRRNAPNLRRYAVERNESACETSNWIRSSRLPLMNNIHSSNSSLPPPPLNSKLTSPPPPRSSAPPLPRDQLPEVLAGTLDHIVGQLDGLTRTMALLDKRLSLQEDMMARYVYREAEEGEGK